MSAGLTASCSYLRDERLLLSDLPDELLLLLLLREGVPLLRLLLPLLLETVALLRLLLPLLLETVALLRPLVLRLCDLAAGADELRETVDDDLCDTDWREGALCIVACDFEAGGCEERCTVDCDLVDELCDLCTVACDLVVEGCELLFTVVEVALRVSVPWLAAWLPFVLLPVVAALLLSLLTADC